MKRIYLTASLIFMLMSVALAQSPQQALTQYISDLQKNPNDYALREKIIKHAQTMRPAPAIPTEAERFEGRAEFAVKNAKTEADFLDAAKEYEKALQIAPWVPAYYFNQGIAFEKGGKLKEAKQSFEFYLIAVPNAQDAREVRKRIAGLEYAIEKAAKEKSPQAIASSKQNTLEDLLRKIDGRRYTCPLTDAQGWKYLMVIDIAGKVFRLGTIYPQSYDVPSLRGYIEAERDEIRGRETIVPLTQHLSFLKVWAVSRTYIIGEDGERITYRVRFSDGDSRDYIHFWQR